MSQLWFYLFVNVSFACVKLKGNETRQNGKRAREKGREKRKKKRRVNGSNTRRASETEK